MLDLSIVILTFNSENFIVRCLDSVIKWTGGVGYEIVVVDNASIDRTVDTVKKFMKSVQFDTGLENFQLIENKKNAGFAAGNNAGIKKARGRYVLLLNPDTELVENSLKIMVSSIDRQPKVGIASC